MFASEVTERVIAAYEDGGLITSCAWCQRVEFDGEWHRAPLVALTAIDAPRTLSHSICPPCEILHQPSLE